MQNAFRTSYNLLTSFGWSIPTSVLYNETYHPAFAYSETQSQVDIYLFYTDGTVSSDCTSVNTAVDLPAGITLTNPLYQRTCCYYPDQKKCPVVF